MASQQHNDSSGRIDSPVASESDGGVAAWTPGPWHAEGPDWAGDYNIVRNGAEFALAAVVSNMRAPKTVEANARLIAAAPDLFAALELLRDTTLWHLSRTGKSAADAGLLGVIDDAFVALSKARSTA